MANHTTRLISLLAALAITAAACGADDSTSSDATSETSETAGAGSFELVSATDADAIRQSPPEDLVILDVRTPDEFAAGHIEGAIMLDFYDADFAGQLAELDPDVPYLVYCRSGNRSGQTADLMAELGFTDVTDVDGGILSWAEAGLPVVSE